MKALTFEYKEHSTVSLSGMRWYKINDAIYPSVTSVLGMTAPAEKKKSLENWRVALGASKADAYTKKCGDRGTILHLMLEQYLRGEEISVPGMTHVEQGMFNGIKMKLKRLDHMVGQEVVLYSDALEVAGRCDLIGVYKGELSIIDFKSSTNSKSDERIEDYKLQLCMYGLFHNEMFGTDIKTGVILMACENSIPMEFKIEFTNELIGKVIKRIDDFYANLKV